MCLGSGTLASFLNPLCFSFLTCKMGLLMMPPGRIRVTYLQGAPQAKYQVCWCCFYLTYCQLPLRSLPLIPAAIFMYLSLGPQLTDHFLLDPSQGLSLGHPYCPRDSVVLSILELSSSGVPPRGYPQVWAWAQPSNNPNGKSGHFQSS